MSNKDELKKHYPQFPFRDPHHVIHCMYPDQRVLIMTFATEYAAKKFLEELMTDEEVKWERRTECELKGGMKIKSKSLEDLLDYEYASKAEREWQLPDHYKLYVQHFKYGLPKEKPHPQPTTDEDRPTPRVSREPRPTKRKSREGMVTAATLADELNISPQQFRKALRAAKIDKPEGGWVWDEKEAVKITHAVKKFIK